MERFPALRWTGIGWAAEPKLPTLPIRWLRSTSESAVSARTLGIIFRGLYCRGTDCRADRSQAINARHFHGAGDLDDYGHSVLLQLALHYFTHSPQPPAPYDPTSSLPIYISFMALTGFETVSAAP